MTCTDDDHEWNPGGVNDAGERFMICEVCAATVPPPVAEPGVQLVELPAEVATPDP